MPERVLIGSRELPAGWLKSAAAPLLTMPVTVVRSYRYATGSISIRLVGPAAIFLGSRPDGVFLITQKHHRPGWIFLPGPEHLETYLPKSLQSWVAESWTKALRNICRERDRENKLLPISGNGNGEVSINVKGEAAYAAEDAEVIGNSFQDLIKLLCGSVGPEKPSLRA